MIAAAIFSFAGVHAWLNQGVDGGLTFAFGCFVVAGLCATGAL